MDYMTLKEASEKWGVTPRWINYYCAASRIPGAIKMGTVYFIESILLGTEIPPLVFFQSQSKIEVIDRRHRAGIKLP